VGFLDFDVLAARQAAEMPRDRPVEVVGQDDVMGGDEAKGVLGNGQRLEWGLPGKDHVDL
jgi:hypothetical protein